ncbi:hypothetical protein SAMN04487819_1402, partial [Actinopolyspora alba]
MHKTTTAWTRITRHLLNLHPILTPIVIYPMIRLKVSNNTSRTSRTEFTRIWIKETTHFLLVLFHENTRPAPVTSTHKILSSVIVLSHGIESHFLTMPFIVIIEVLVATPIITKTVVVVDEYGCLARDRIVRVGVVDGEVVDSLQRGPGADAGDQPLLTLSGTHPIPGLEILGVDPLVPVGHPERVLPRRRHRVGRPTSVTIDIDGDLYQVFLTLAGDG